MSLEAKMDQIDRLFSAFQGRASAEADSAQNLRNYMLAVDAWELSDVAAAVDALIGGNAPGVHRGFMPTSAELGGECRRQHGLRIDSAKRERERYAPALSPPIHKSPESRQRVREMVQNAAVVKMAEEVPYWQYGELPPPGGWKTYPHD